MMTALEGPSMARQFFFACGLRWRGLHAVKPPASP